MSVPFSRRLLFSGALVARPVSRLLSVLSLGFGKKSRVEAATELRERLAIQQGKRLESSMATNHDEDALPARIACFSKGLAKNEHGEVQPAAYNALLTAIQSGKHSDFEQIPRGGGRKLNNPQAAYSFDLEGGDPHTFNISAPPSLTCEALAVEASELYWQALARDVPFSNFGKAVVLQQATEHLSVTPESLFRGLTRGDAKGPYVSQFLLKPIPYGSAKVNQQYSVPRPGSGFHLAGGREP